MCLKALLLLALVVSGLAAAGIFTGSGSFLSVESPDVIYENQLVTFNCSLSEGVFGAVNYSWFRDGMLLSSESALEVQVPLTWDGSCLSCSVQDQSGAGANISITLTVVVRSPTLLEGPTNQTLSEGQGLTLSCTILGLPAPTLRWFVDGQFIFDYLDQSSINIPSVSGDDAGEYWCTGSNNHGVVVSPVAYVRVLFGPVIDTSPEDTTVLAGTLAILNCSARGDPPPSLSWWRNGELVDPNSDPRVQVHENGSLTVQNVMLGDMGAYQCEAVNSQGTTESDEALLTVDVFPMFLRTPTDVTVRLPHPLQLNCSAGGIPEPSYMWLHSVGSSMVLVELDDRVTEVNGTLMISPTEREDAGGYSCQAMNMYGTITSSPPATVTVLAPPLPPVVRAGQVGSSWVQVVWDPPTNPVLPVVGYILEYKLMLESTWTEVNASAPPFYFNLSTLYPSGQYQVRVYAISVFGMSEASAVLAVNTSEGVPVEGLLDSVEEVTVHSTAPDTLQVNWTIPQVLEQTAHNRTLLTVRNVSGGVVVMRHEVVSPALVQDLRPATNYTLDLVLEFVGGGEGPPVSLQVTTLEGVPDDAPTVLETVALGPTSIRVMWTPPTLPNGVIVFYTLYYASATSTTVTESHLMNVTLNGAAESHDLVDLHPHTNYTILISASTVVGEGPRGPGGGVVVTTEQDVPPAVGGVGVGVLNSTALLVTWNPYTSVPGILTHFNITYNHLSLATNADQTGVVLANLVPFTIYTVQVAGSTEAGLGPFSDPQHVQTLGDVPSAVVEDLHVEVVCPTALLLLWRPVDATLLGGPESEVEYLVTFSASGSQSRSQAFTYNSSLKTFLLEDIVPFTNYTLELSLQNENGTGVPSSQVDVTSCDGPAPPPLHVATENVSSTAVSVSWQAPSAVPGQLIGFVVRYRRRDQSEYTQNTTREEGIMISGLEPFTEYQVGVASRTRGPVGNFSSTTFRTRGSVPVAMVMIISVEPACPSNLLVAWSPLPPEDLLAPPENSSYVVSYSPTSGGGVVVMEEVIYSPVAAMANLTGLELDTEYDVRVRVQNSYGLGPDSIAVVNRTLNEGIPGVPTDVTVTAVSSTSLEVMWAASSTPQPSFSLLYHPTATADSTQWDTWVRAIPTSSSPFAVVLEGLEPFTNYSVVVLASGRCGIVASSAMIARTQEDLSTPPANLSVVAVLPSRVKVQWDIPRHPNGIIRRYNVYCPGGVVSVDASELTHECEGLASDTKHEFAVSAVNLAGESRNATVSGNTTCSPRPPSVEDGVISQPSSCTVGTVFVLVVVQELVSYQGGDHDPPTRPVSDYSLEELKQSTNDYQRQRRGRRRRQTRPLNENGEGVYIAANLTGEVEGFRLGDGEDYGNYTNYRLTANIFYSVTLWGAVPGTDTPILATMETPFSLEGEQEPEEPPFPLVPVVAGAGGAGVLILAICMAAVFSCVCCCCSRSLDKVDGVTGVRMERTGSFRHSKRKLVDPVEEFRASNRTEVLEDHPPVPVMGFINKLMVMKTNDNQLFLEEFGSIPMTIPHLSTEAASTTANKPKNRYNNILPYDSTRVKIKGHGTDYINANYCSGYRKTKAYIATQGPLPDTVGDFWKLVWEENSRTIVMLTNTQEKGKVKCESYWPREVGSSIVYGHLDVCLVAVTTLADYSIRTFALHKVGSSKEPREVVQFHFTSWPDHGVPQYATAMLSLLRRVRAHYGKNCPEEGPMVVHCSAGVGRTGTFIVIDTMLQRLMHEEEMVDIYGHVSLLRTQRNYMIQTEDQYFFVHEAVAEALLCGNTEVSLDSLPGYIETLCAVIPDDETESTNLELEFKRLALERHDPHRWLTASKDANKAKNRFVNVLPYDTSRVCLEYSPGVDGSDYINASHVDSYHNRRAFIATQGPLVGTVVDYWRMLWQYQVPVVVMLTEEVEKGRECSACYWPGAILQPVDYGKLRVELNVERNSGSYTYRDLCVTNTTDNQTRLVRHFQFHGWPEVGVPPSATLIEFIREVQKLCRSLVAPHGPIVVHCSNGVGRTGVFMSLHVILERMLVEGLVDVFQTVKNLRIQRPAMVQTLEQYHLCYDAALTFLQSSEFLKPAMQSALSRQRSSSQRNSGSRHGSMGSLDSRKKSVNSSPTRSPMRSLSQRNTPMRSDSFKDSPKGTMELGTTQGGGAQVYGGSDATSTFGSHCTPPPAGVVAATDPHGSHSQLSSSNTQLPGTHPLPGGTPLEMPDGNPQPVSSHAPVLTHTPVVGSHTPVMGSHTPVVGAHVPVVPGTPVPVPVASSAAHTPAMAHSMPVDTPVQLQRGAATSESSHIYHGYHGSLPRKKNENQLMFNGTSSPLSGYAVSEPPSGLSQSPVYNGAHDAYGSQSQSSMFSDSSLLLPASTTVHTAQLNTSSIPAPQHNSHHYHQLLEQQHAPPHPTPSLHPESTKL